MVARIWNGSRKDHQLKLVARDRLGLRSLIHSVRMAAALARSVPHIIQHCAWGSADLEMYGRPCFQPCKVLRRE